MSEIKEGVEPPISIVETENSTGRHKKQKLFFPNLDGLRFFCFLSVFLFHSFATDYNYIKETRLYTFIKFFLVRNGNLGVNFFFVLSGFLITYLLIVEKEKYGRIDIKSFYVRRILRIWPLFYVCVFFGFVIFPHLKALFGQTPNETAHWSYYLGFINNFDYIRHSADSSELTILWSVAIEEQFYLVWPLILMLLPTRHYLQVFGLIIVGSFFFRLMNAHNPVILEHHTLSCISDMTIGGVSATLIHFKPNIRARIKNLNKWIIALLYLAIILIFLFRNQIFGGHAILLASDRLIISALFAFVILEQNYSEHSLFKMSKYKRISKLGTYTYGLYCLHMIGILIVSTLLRKAQLNRNVYEVIFIEGGGSLIITMIIAWFSYTYYESWFLKFKNKFSRISKN